MPATNASSERSFSALRRIKTYLRATMKQDRLVYLMVHIHRELTDKLDLISIANLFVSGSEHRQTLFGKFTSSDI
jgi:histone deacetylase complex regulatory component SIN3